MIIIKYCIQCILLYIFLFNYRMQSKQKSMISIGEYSKYSLKYNPYVLLEKLTLIEDRTKYE
jgi:hypothetical protein